MNTHSDPTFETHLRSFPDGTRRVLIEYVTPAVDGGRFPIKRILGDALEVEADLIADGHDGVRGVLRFRHEHDRAWRETPMMMHAAMADRHVGSIVLDRLGRWEIGVVGWVDAFASWRDRFAIKAAAESDIEVELEIGAQMIETAVVRAEAAKDAAKAAEAAELARVAHMMRDSAIDQPTRIRVALDNALGTMMATYPDRSTASEIPHATSVIVDPVLARFSTWYEFFPRSTGENGRHGTFRTAQTMLSYIAQMGFDVVYLPPIHPIGTTNRKGKNNSLAAEPDDVGSPWAIGAKTGGHTAIHPDLGTLDDFRDFVNAANRLGLHVALDMAFQCSPDHPYVQDHPEWFFHRPDGTIQYAENPPKKYQDVVPLNFECADWRGLWAELRGVFAFWIAEGVTVFRVDNPHTKPLAFWEWCIGSLKAEHPEVIFLSEAFTRPKLMYALAKLGFTQSYTYFTWRNTKAEFEQYLSELTQTAVGEFLRPNFWPNTPDILPEHLQHGGRAAFVARYVLAATLSSNIGIYGPAFELMDHLPRPHAEEYIDNEKYELKRWELSRPDSLRAIIARINAIRADNLALQAQSNLRFHRTDNDRLICYSKHTTDGANVILTVVNLDFFHAQSGHVELDLDSLGLSSETVYQVHDLLTNARFLWVGARNFVELAPQSVPAHIFRLRRFVRREQHFEYYA